MDLAQLANLGEFIGGVTVLVTLLYLATQIRHNTNQLKGEAIISINDAEFELDKEVRGDLALFETVIRGMSDWKSLNHEQQAQVHLYVYSYARWAETCWTLWRRDALDTETYLSRERFILSYLGHPEGGRIWWEQWKSIFDPRFASHLDTRWAETDSAQTLIHVAPFYEPWQGKS